MAKVEWEKVFVHLTRSVKRALVAELAETASPDMTGPESEPFGKFHGEWNYTIHPATH
jgi:hypothetical protein